MNGESAVARRCFSRAALAVVVGLVGSAGALDGQTMYESAAGQSAIVVHGTGLALINFADKSVKLGFERAVTSPSWRFGTEVKAIASDGVVELFDPEGDAALPHGEGSAWVGYIWSPTSGIVVDHWVTARTTYSYARHTLVDTTSTATDRLSATTVHAAGVTGYYNALLALGPELDGLLGVAVGYGKRTNYEDLGKREVCTYTGAPAPGESIVQDCESGRVGDAYAVGRSWTAALDVLLYPHFLANRVGVNGFVHYDGARESGGAVVPGIGLFFTKAGAPLQTLGGLTLELRDDEPRLGFVAGVPF